MSSLGRLLILAGLFLLLAGTGLLLGTRLHIPLGRLPGDIVIVRGGFRFFFPVTSLIVVSALFSVLAYIVRRWLH